MASQKGSDPVGYLRPIGYKSVMEVDRPDVVGRLVSELDAAQLNDVEVEGIKNLGSVTRHEGCKRAFRHHLRTCHADENLDFVLAVEEYEKCSDANGRAQMLNEIFDVFLAENAPKPISIDWVVRQDIEQKRGQAAVDLFLEGKRLVELALEHDQLLRFRKFIESKQDAPYDIEAMKSIEAILCNKRALRDFRAYLEANYCCENLDFILAAIKYEKCNQREERKLMLNNIVETYLSSASDQQISIDWSIHQSILHSMENPTDNSLLLAKRMVTMTLEHDHLFQFRRNSAPDLSVE